MSGFIGFCVTVALLGALGFLAYQYDMVMKDRICAIEREMNIGPFPFENGYDMCADR